MKKIFILSWLAVIVTTAFSQKPTADNIETSKGPLVIQPITHGSVVLTWNSLTIYVDPYGGIKGYDGIAPPDLVLITDIHGDHLNPETLTALDLSKAKLIVPQAVADQLPEQVKSKAIVLSNGKNITQSGVSVTAIPMYNLPDDAESKHTKGRGNGYVLNLGGKQVYFSGDTEDIPEMRALRNIDVAFVCMNLPYTMDIKQASSAVLEFKPGIVYPYHYRGQSGLADVEGFKKLVAEGNKSIDVRLRNWYPAN